MKSLYIGSIIIVIILLVYGSVKLRTVRKTETTSFLFASFVATLIAMVANLVYKLTAIEWLALLSHGIFFAMMDWILIFLLMFVRVYTDGFKEITAVKTGCFIFAFIDNLQFIANVWLKHVYTVQYVRYDAGYSFFTVDHFYGYYYVHLAFSYFLVFFIVITLIPKYMKVSSFYKKKYFIILLLFALTIFADAVVLFLEFPFDYSFVCYGLLGIALYYFVVYYIPNGLVTTALTLMVQDLDMAFIYADEEGKCIYMNDQAKRYLVGKSDEEINRNLQKFMHKRDVPGKDSVVWTEQREMEGHNRHFEGEWKKYYDEKGRFIGSHIKIMDRTDWVEMYEREIELAEESNRAKSNFLMTMSHEIRTPINSVYGMTEMILRECTEEEIKKYAMDIKTSSQTLISIINDILDFSKIESGKMELAEGKYELADLIGNLYNIMSVKAYEKELSLRVEVDPDLPNRLYGDDVRLQQILLNLLSNAVKYTHEGSVFLKVEGEMKEADVILRFFVKDTGIGMKEEDIPKLFEAFRRIEESRNRHIQGTGLGMNITVQLLKLMNSELKVTSVYGKGSEFSFELRQPIVDRTPIGDYDEVIRKKAKEYEYHAAFVNRDAKILVVDDNRVNRRVFKGLLKWTMAQISEAASGMECLEMVKKEKFDLIFLDHLMPEMDGMETMVHLQSSNHMNKETPIIMLTANAMAGARDEYLKAGFKEFLAKPINSVQLEEIICKYLQNVGKTST